MITQKSIKLSESHYRNMIRSFMNSEAINRSFLENRISINDGLFLCSFRIRVGLPLSKFVYLREAVSAAFKGRGVQVVF